MGYVALAIVVLLVVGWPLARRITLEREVRGTLTRYALALAETTRELDLAPITDLAGDRQITRVRTYLILLEGTGVRLDSDLLALDVEQVRSEGVTVTATAVERWRFAQQSIATAEQVGETTEIERVVNYTLLRDPQGRLIVHMALFDDEEDRP
jgi:hypothetical protein